VHLHRTLAARPKAEATPWLNPKPPATGQPPALAPARTPILMQPKNWPLYGARTIYRTRIKTSRLHSKAADR
jgi:hypothetical protein